MSSKKKTGKTTSAKRGKGATPPPPGAASTKEARPAPGETSGGRVVDGSKPRTRHPRQKREGLSGLDAAAKVLGDAGEALDAKTIAQRAIAAGWKTSGKTPHATLYSAMLREIKAKGKESRFAKVDKGRFTAAGKAG